MWQRAENTSVEDLANNDHNQDNDKKDEDNQDDNNHNTGPRIRGLHTSSLYQWQTLVCYTGQCHHHQHHGGRKKSQQTKSKMKIWYFV